MYKVVSDFELEEKKYKAGDAFTPPSNWKEEQKLIDDTGMRFSVPFEVEGNKSTHWIILPLEKVVEAAPEPVKAEKPKEE